MSQIPTAICKVMRAWQSSAGLTKYIYRKSIYRFGSLSMGAPTGDVRLDAESLAAEHFSASRACEVRHIALSFPADVSREEALERLPRMCADWAAKYAPGRDWVAGIHFDNGLFHAHMAVQNVKDGKALRLLPHMVQGMARMEFTVHARDAKGVGSPGLRFYSKPAKPLLADVVRAASKEQIYEWIHEGKIRPGRVDSHGVVTSIELDPGDGKKSRRIRLDTLQRLSTRASVATGGDSAIAQSGAGSKSGLGRCGRPRPHRRSARRRGTRRLCGSLDRKHQQNSPVQSFPRPALPGLFRDPLPGSKLAPASRTSLASRSRGSVAISVRGVGLLKNILQHVSNQKQKDNKMPTHLIDPRAALPPELKKNLIAVDFSEGDVKALEQDMAVLRRQQQMARELFVAKTPKPKSH
jgi:hypothetical protein